MRAAWWTKVGLASGRFVRSRAGSFALSAAIVIVATYCALLVAEIGLWMAEPRVSQQRGLYLPDTVTGVVLKPGYQGSFDDGYAKGRIRINSLGDRDDEPQPDAARRVLLIGDSFTFGLLLDQSATIDKWIERDRPGIDAYNLGVSGYDLPNQLDALRRTRLLGSDVIYLFFGNDLRPPQEQTVYDGYRVTRQYGRGDKRLTDGQMAAIVQSYERSEKGWHFPPRRSVLLPQLRDLARRAFTVLERRGAAPDYDFPASQRERFVARGLRHTLEMQALAKQRGMRFHVVIIPAAPEVRAGAHSKSVTEYMARLRMAGIATVDLLPRLSVDDYWTHDIHFNPSGAKVAAQAIVEALPTVRGGR